MEASRLPCDDDPTCKYYATGCFEDVHHLYQNGSERTATERVFRELPQNKVRVCRSTHELMEREVGWLPYPPIETMREAIRESSVFISRSRRKKVFGNKEP